jgi:hypothetical protein
LDRQEVKIVGKDGSLVLERSEIGSPGTPADRDILLNVTVDAGGFAAVDQSWIVDRDWTGFLAELRQLDARRQGRATLESASPGDLRIEFFSTDSAGHMAIRGQVRRPTGENFELRLQFGFAFEPDALPRILSELEGLGRT